MKCWIVVYQHRHGVESWPLFQDSRPTHRAMIKGLESWEPRVEGIGAMGPFVVPDPPARSWDAGYREGWNTGYSTGWDSHEGSLLKCLGVRDLECRGIDQVVKDLTLHCPGFKEWRRRFKLGSMEQKEARRRYRESLKKVQDADHIISITKKKR